MVASFGAVVWVAVAVLGNRKLVLDAPAPPAPPPPPVVRLPVQLAPVGQQAILSASSRAHSEPCRQQMSVLSMFEQALYPAGQSPSRFNNRRRMSYAPLPDSGVSGGENGRVSVDKTVEARNVAEIHPDNFILSGLGLSLARHAVSQYTNSSRRPRASVKLSSRVSNARIVLSVERTGTG